MASCNTCNYCNLPVCIHKVFGLLVGSCLCPSQPKLSWYATRIRTEPPECRPKIRAHPQSQLVKKYASNCLLHVYLIYQYLASQKNADWNMSTDCAFLMKIAILSYVFLRSVRITHSKDRGIWIMAALLWLVHAFQPHVLSSDLYILWPWFVWEPGVGIKFKKNWKNKTWWIHLVEYDT